jgi:aminoglycoside 3-N-acetyltransferase
MLVADLDAFLERLGVDDNSDLFVHSGYRAFRTEGFSVDQVLDGLIARQPTKAIMLPAFNWRAVNPENGFDVRKTPSIVGALTEAYRARPGIRRTLHPTHSCLIPQPAFGTYGGTHPRSYSPCDELSPFVAFADRKVRIVLLNCAIDTMTYIHHFEEMIYPEHYLGDNSEVVEMTDENGEKREFILRRHRKLPRRFANFFDSLAACPSFRHHTAGGIAGWSISADDAAFVISRKFAENIYASL